MDIELLSDEWLAAQIHEKKDGEFNHWSVDYVIDMTFEDQYPELWKFIKLTYPKDCPDNVLGVLAAGALEDFLVGAGEEYYEEISELARKDQKFKHLLGGVWQNEMSPEFWSKICDLRGAGW